MRTLFLYICLLRGFESDIELGSRDVTRRCKRETIAQELNHWRAPKSAKFSQVLSSTKYICSHKTLVSNMGAPNLFPAQGAIYTR